MPFTSGISFFFFFFLNQLFTNSKCFTSFCMILKLLRGKYSVVQIVLKTTVLGFVSPMLGQLIDSVSNTTVITWRKLGIMKLVLLILYSSHMVWHLFLHSNFSSRAIQLRYVHRQWYSNEKDQESPFWKAKLQPLLPVHINAATQIQ